MRCADSATVPHNPLALHAQQEPTGCQQHAGLGSSRKALLLMLLSQAMLCEPGCHQFVFMSPQLDPSYHISCSWGAAMRCWDCTWHTTACWELPQLCSMLHGVVWAALWWQLQLFPGCTPRPCGNCFLFRAPLQHRRCGQVLTTMNARALILCAQSASRCCPHCCDTGALHPHEQCCAWGFVCTVERALRPVVRCRIAPVG